MNDVQRVKARLLLLLFSFVALFLFALSKKQEAPRPITAVETLDQKESNDTRLLETNVDGEKAIEGSPLPTIEITQLGKAFGKTSAIKFEKDLETSLTVQEIPNIWLEFIDSDGQTKKVNVPHKAIEHIKKRWTRTLILTQENFDTKTREEKIAVTEEFIDNAAVLATNLTEIQIVTPFEKRNISLDESFDIIHFTTKLAQERYVKIYKMSEFIAVDS